MDEVVLLFFDLTSHPPLTAIIIDCISATTAQIFSKFETKAKGKQIKVMEDNLVILKVQYLSSQRSDQRATFYAKV